ncbi:MAG: membrane protein insertase YidC [Gallionella sp.]|nr:membrane protein insertase YidC [Gallionella sp.]MDD4945390.1 membrane protein insertase YidC [Gallionella sp.]
MDFQRLFLFLIFSFSLMMVWDGWQRYQHPELVAQSETAPAKSDSPASNKAVTDQTLTAKQLVVAESGKIIKIKTDVIEAEINTTGGNIQHLDLLKHPDALDKNKGVILFDKGEGKNTYIAQSGLLGSEMPNHNTLFTASQDNYQLQDNENQVQIKMLAVSSSGVQVAKIFTFHKGSYVIDISYEISNSSKAEVKTSAYFQFIRGNEAPEGDSKMVPTYTGPAVYTEQEKFQKVAFGDIDKNKIPYPKESDNGWIGMLQHYFVAAWIPSEKTNREYFTRKLEGGLYSAGVVVPVSAIAPGKATVVDMRLYAGPAQSKLNKIAPGLGLSVDYGWLTILATPIFWMLTFLEGIVKNWGVAIILLTVMIKLAFFPLSAASYRSMGKMRAVAPKLEKIKQQYGDDRERLNKAMMELYKTEKINPLGGCLPMLIQIPVFIALYWSILASVEMRYAPFFGWITDLSKADPYYILPLIMGASMFLQSKLNPVPPDPIQAKVMQIMPVAFSVVFFFFPAGLVLYSIVNNVLSIAQQWYITREIGVEGATAKR